MAPLYLYKKAIQLSDMSCIHPHLKMHDHIALHYKIMNYHICVYFYEAYFSAYILARIYYCTPETLLHNRSVDPCFILALYS